jgi:hypothetical protein
MRGPHHPGGHRNRKHGPVHGHFHRPFFRPIWAPFGGLGCLFGLVPLIAIGIFFVRMLFGPF